MYEIIFLLVLGFVWVLFASVQDLKKREVADWLNFSLIIFALGFRFFYCLFDVNLNATSGNFMFFYQGLIGLGIFFAVGNLLYYSHFFAGGDTKLMIALGTVLPLSNSFITNLNIFMVFFLVFLFTGAIYGLICSFVLAFGNFEKFKKQFNSLLKKNKNVVYLIMILALIFMIVGFMLKSVMFYFGILFFVLPYLYLFAKAVEEVCMVKKVDSKNLVEGDWLYKDVKVGNRLIRAKWDGLNKEEIALIKKSKEQVLIKHGIPFVPVFLISFLILVYFLWNSFWNLNVF